MFGYQHFVNENNIVCIYIVSTETIKTHNGKQENVVEHLTCTTLWRLWYQTEPLQFCKTLNQSLHIFTMLWIIQLGEYYTDLRICFLEYSCFVMKKTLKIIQCSLSI